MARARRALALLALVGVLALSVLMLLPPLIGYERYVIAGGSMAGSIPNGSIVYERLVPVSRLNVGDVITYDPPPGSHLEGKITHRIVWVGRDRWGARAFQTKGDANDTRDRWRFTLPARSQPVVRFHVPVAGFGLAVLGIRPVRMLVIGVPALLIALVAFRDAWRATRMPRPEPGAPSV